MFGLLAGKVFFDALILCGLLYLVARHEADTDFQKLAMVVAGTALGNVILGVGVTQVAPLRIQVWLIPLLEVAFSAVMIMTFCWISFWRSLLVVMMFSALHLGFGFAAQAVARRLLGETRTGPSMTEQHERDIQETKQEMERLAKAQMDAYERAHPAPPPEPATEVGSSPSPAPPPPGPPVVSNTAVTASPPPAPGAAAVGGERVGRVLDSPEWEEARKELRVGGISRRGADFTALVNQRMVRVGDTVSVPRQGRVYRWTVREITLDGVQFEPKGVGGPPAH